jgi:hypothetical protein
MKRQLNRSARTVSTLPRLVAGTDRENNTLHDRYFLQNRFRSAAGLARTVEMVESAKPERL